MTVTKDILDPPVSTCFWMPLHSGPLLMVARAISRLVFTPMMLSSSSPAPTLRLFGALCSPHKIELNTPQPSLLLLPFFSIFQALHLKRSRVAANLQSLSAQRKQYAS